MQNLEKHHNVSVESRRTRRSRGRVRKGERFDIIFSDLMMPQMIGMELHDAMRLVDKAQAERMVFITGGAFTTSAREFLDRVPNLLLRGNAEHAAHPGYGGRSHEWS